MRKRPEEPSDGLIHESMLDRLLRRLIRPRVEAPLEQVRVTQAGHTELRWAPLRLQYVTYAPSTGLSVVVQGGRVSLAAGVVEVPGATVVIPQPQAGATYWLYVDAAGALAADLQPPAVGSIPCGSVTCPVAWPATVQWRGFVAGTADLAGVGTRAAGDAWVVLAEQSMYRWSGSTWERLALVADQRPWFSAGGGGGGDPSWKGSVATVPDLPGSGNQDGDVRAVASEDGGPPALYRYRAATGLWERVGQRLFTLTGAEQTRILGPMSLPTVPLGVIAAAPVDMTDGASYRLGSLGRTGGSGTLMVDANPAVIQSRVRLTLGTSVLPERCFDEVVRAPDFPEGTRGGVLSVTLAAEVQCGAVALLTAKEYSTGAWDCIRTQQVPLAAADWLDGLQSGLSSGYTLQGSLATGLPVISTKGGVATGATGTVAGSHYVTGAIAGTAGYALVDPRLPPVAGSGTWSPTAGGTVGTTGVAALQQCANTATDAQGNLMGSDYGLPLATGASITLG